MDGARSLATCFANSLESTSTSTPRSEGSRRTSQIGVFRLRKVCLHAVAITKCEISADGVHVMTTELRATYEQMDAVWKCLPDEFRFNEDRSWWANEAKDGLAAYNHPTAVSLVLPLAAGGFGDADAPESYLRLAVWLGRLGCGYGLALSYLARVLGTEGDIDSRLTVVLSDMRL